MGDLVRIDPRGLRKEAAPPRPKFGPGDLFALVVGGKVMAIDVAHGSDVYECVWHDDCNGAQRETYSGAALEPYVPAAPAPPRRRPARKSPRT